MTQKQVHYENKTRFDVYRQVSNGQWYLETDEILVKIDENTFNRIANASKGRFQNLKYKCPKCNKVLKYCKCN